MTTAALFWESLLAGRSRGRRTLNHAVVWQREREIPARRDVHRDFREPPLALQPILGSLPAPLTGARCCAINRAAGRGARRLNCVRRSSDLMCRLRLHAVLSFSLWFLLLGLVQLRSNF